MEALTPNELRYLSPLRYPGGKGKLAPYIASLVDTNGLDGGTYLEPYAGGAGVALHLLFTRRVKTVVLNDIDVGVHAFWHSVLHCADELCSLISRTRITIQAWARQNETYRDPSATALQRGFATFFLNRTNRSGIICSGGAIGGKRQAGELTLSARFNKRALIKRIERIANLSSSIKLQNKDALQVLSEAPHACTERQLWYLDPPYYIKGRRRLYSNFYEARDHRSIADALLTSKAKWVITYDDDPFIRSLYAQCPMRPYSIHYSATRAYQGREIMYLSPGMMFAPEDHSP